MGERVRFYTDEHVDVLSRSSAIVVSCDGVILDRCGRWLNLAREVVERKIPHAQIVPLEAVSKLD